MEDDAKEHELVRNGTSMSTCRWGSTCETGVILYALGVTVFIPVEQLERREWSGRPVSFDFAKQATYIRPGRYI
jgi:hypothetical protein